jgi:hypothetical protein
MKSIPTSLPPRWFKKPFNIFFPPCSVLRSAPSSSFIPFVLMSGVAGAYFKVMTNTMIITLVCSFFVTWIGLPVDLSAVEPAPGNHPHDQAA